MALERTEIVYPRQPGDATVIDSHGEGLFPGTGEAGSRKSRAGLFCPVEGLDQQEISRFSQETRDLLLKRLRVAAAILCAGFVAFLIRNLLYLGSAGYPQLIFGGHIALIVITAGCGAWLVVQRCWTLSSLRRIELVVFLAPAIFFAWLRYYSACHLVPVPDTVSELLEPPPPDLPHDIAPAAAMEEPSAGPMSGPILLDPYTIAISAAFSAAFVPETAIPWILLIQIYGLFIPNTWRRSAAIISLFAIAPILLAIIVASVQPAIDFVLWRAGGFSELTLWMAISAVVGVYGSHRFGRLSREVFDARSIGVYTLKRRLGKGGMGEVFLAEHHLLKRQCAIKIIRPEKSHDENALARFEGEVQTTAKLTHPNTVEIYDYGRTADGTFYYVMEYLPGLNLQELVDRHGPIPPERVVFILRQVCAALHEAHSVGLIHRDLKPGNIFSAERGGMYDVAKLLDFGLVRSVKRDPESAKLTLDGSIVGSPLFGSPEMAADEELDERSDIYSLGTTAYFLLTSQPVFEAENPLKIVFAHVNETPKSPSQILPDIPEDLERIVLKCLEKKREDRYQNVGELMAALDECSFTEPWSHEQAAEWWSRFTRLGGEVEISARSTAPVSLTTAENTQAT